MPVGHIWKFDLEEHENTWFWNEVLFFKNSNGACHAQFSRDNLKHKIKKENDRIDNCGKVTEKQREIAIRNFQDNKKNHETRAVLS